jgi:hypothetical protein
VLRYLLLLGLLLLGLLLLDIEQRNCASLSLQHRSKTGQTRPRNHRAV